MPTPKEGQRIATTPSAWATAIITWVFVGASVAAGANELNKFLTKSNEDLEALVSKRTQELREAKDVAEKASIAKSDFLSVVSHELRTPLTSIRGSLALLNGQFLSDMPDEAANMVKLALRNSEKLSVLVDDILDLEKIQAGHMTFARTEIDLSSLIARAIEENQPYAERLDVSFRIGESVPGITVMGDEVRLLQVLANVMSNAAKFSSPNDWVTISWAWHTFERNGKSVDGVRISVADVGPGIPEAFRPRIFRPFEQADSSSTRNVSGTGLGLSISKAIVNAHGGQISFETALGKGTVFHVDLPMMSIVTGRND